MATHAALAAGGRSRSTKGYLASIRNLVLYANRLDTLEGDLIVETEQIIGESRRALYTFCVTADGRILMVGRAAAVFEVTSS